MSSRIAVMIEGHIVQVGTPAEVYENPQDIRVAEFVGSPKINAMPGVIREDGGLEVLGRPLGLSTSAAAGRCSVCVRPERMELGTGPGAISGSVVHLEHLGSEAFVHVKVDRIDLPLLARLNPDRQLPAIGSSVHLTYSANAARIFDAAGKRVETSPRRFAADACWSRPLADTLTANALPAERRPAAITPARTQGASRARPALAMVAPAFILMCLLLLGPLLGVIALSFTDYQLGSPTFAWIGLENYREMLADRVFWTSLRNTLTYVAIVVPAAVALGLGVALLIESGGSLRAWYRTIYFLPVMATLIAMSIVWEFMLHPQFGLVNGLLRGVGLRVTAGCRTVAPRFMRSA